MELPENTAELPLPEISGYRITEPLYVGDKTAVYRAIATESQTSVVIKILRQAYPSASELLQFRNQYTITQQLSIPGIVSPYRVEVYGNREALVMEDWGGISLANYLKHPVDRSKQDSQTSQQHKSPGLSIVEVLSIAIQLADILHDLSQHSIIHQDIKPANILIHPISKQVKLIDFSIASCLPKEHQSITNPNSLEGTLAYIAPEQTGRMNRGIDYRVDFYSLGITLYELLTGQLPFTASDPMALVHCHIAQLPPPPHQNTSEIPLMVSEIVLKLIAKNAEDRYQSALGLKHDLTTCLTQWKETGTIVNFELGQQDHNDRFTLPEKLYGRELEVAQLLAAFDRISGKTAEGQAESQTVELMLVAGFSGVGKTAVVNEVHKPITQQRGYFIKGKFEQFNRNLPLSAFLQALGDLMRQLLSESDSQLAQWRAEILQALGGNGQILVEVIPELEQVIGPQPTAPALSGTAAQNRFNRLFLKFIEVFATPKHPLVLFLDDLQWADRTSLHLIKLLMTDQNSSQGHLLLLGAYRDNEVSPTHPLMLIAEEIAKSTATLNTITLAPLAFADANRLVADTLNCSTVSAGPLTELILQKTQGNPFFTTQFLKALHEEGLIIFNPSQGGWECDITQINVKCLTDNVVDFMAQQLEKLPPATQQVLTLAACIGNQFDLRTLEIVLEQSQTATATALWRALQGGLILPTHQTYKLFQAENTIESSIDQSANPTYRFLHDRVQQAAYSLLPENQRAPIHLSIGRLLRTNLSVEEQAQRRLEVVNHLNQGLDLIDHPLEKADLLQLNILAGQQAHTATAYEPALNYFLKALSLQPEHPWQTDYELTRELYTHIANNAYLSGDLSQAETFLETAFAHTRSLLEKVPLYEIQIQVLVAQQQLQAAIQLGLNILQQLGIDIPEKPGPEDFGQGIQTINRHLAGRTISDLILLPEMTDPVALAALKILLRISAVILMAAPQLMPFAFFQMVGLSIQKGNAALSALGYATYGMILCSAVGDIETGYQFGQLAVTVLDKFSGKAVQAKTMARLNAGVWHWKASLSSTLPTLIETHQIALETGDLEYAAISAQVYANHLYFSGQTLTQVDRELADYGQAVSQFQHPSFLYCIKAYRQHALNLLGQSANPLKLIGEAYDETVDLPHQCETNDAHGIAVVQLFKGMGCYLFEAYDEALEAFEKIRPVIRSIAPFATGCAVPFYDSLTRLAILLENSPKDRDAYFDQVQQNQDKLAHWADHAPMNYLHRFHLVEAEKYHALGDQYQAMEFYDRAIAGAQTQGLVQEEALANELAAKLYLRWGKKNVAAGYLQEAYYGYARWGAIAKTNALENNYPDLLSPILESKTTPTFNPLQTLATVSSTHLTLHSSTQLETTSGYNLNTTLDLATILKASQALSSIIHLDELLHELTQTILQNSGGDKCALVLPNYDGIWQVEVISTPDMTDPCSEPLEDCPHVPVKLIQYVKNTQTEVVIDDLNTDLPVIDLFLTQQQPKSILCLPILNHGKLLGVVYLSNQHTSGIFTTEHILILNFLCTQAAISLDNAHLYQKSQEQEQYLRSLYNGVENLIFVVDALGPDNFRYVGWNSPTEIATGMSSDYIAGKIPEEVFGPENGKHIRQHYRDCLQAKTSISYEECLTLDGQDTWWLTTLNPLRNQEDAIYRIIGTTMSITDLKQTEAALRQSENDLTQKATALGQAMNELQQSQSQLVQAEKMSALGNLVAGVAHEINNPIGFLNGSINNATDYLQDLLDHLDCYQKHYPDAVKPVQDHAEEVDLEFLCEDIPKLLQSMKGATDRIKNISTSLRTFSRADTENKVSANLHEGLDSTILILKYRLKANEVRPAIEIIRDYGDLPPIDCFPGQLNQVFMNILANAIDVFDEAAQQTSYEALTAAPQKITIQTQLTPQQTVEINISDNGKGISEDVKARIFDHLFTTKGVGKGTGLGLAIAHQIVTETHDGTLTVTSELGQGTEFCISLPISG